MARLREVGPVLRKVGAWQFVKNVFHEIGDDGVFTIAAAVAFYWFLAFVPLLIFMLSLLPLLPESVRASTQEQVTKKITEYGAVGSAHDIVTKQMDNLLDPKKPRGGLVSVAMLAAIWASSAGLNATMSALDDCYDIEKRRSFIKQRGLAVIMTIGVVLAVLIVLLLIPISGVALTLLERNLPAQELHRWLSTPTRVLLDLARYTIGLALVMLIISSIYQFGVTVRRRWTLITPGAVFSVFVVLLTAYGFSFYIERMGQTSYNQTYGALAGIVILLLLFYFYAVAFLIGAEINAEIDFAIVGLHDDPAEPNDAPLVASNGEDLERYKQQLITRRKSC
ncbi:MAG: YihY/virulence factor BrkB family protein [Tepidisphaeraceae bacterium]